MAGNEIWIHANSATIWNVDGNTRRQIPASSASTMLFWLMPPELATGAVDKRAVFYPPASIYALEAKQNITDTVGPFGMAKVAPVDPIRVLVDKSERDRFVAEQVALAASAAADIAAMAEAVDDTLDDA